MVVEAWVVHGWDPVVANAPVLEQGNIHQEVHRDDFQDFLDSLFDFDLSGLIFLVLIAVAIIFGFLIVAIILIRVAKTGSPRRTG